MLAGRDYYKNRPRVEKILTRFAGKRTDLYLRKAENDFISLTPLILREMDNEFSA